MVHNHCVGTIDYNNEHVQSTLETANWSAIIIAHMCHSISLNVWLIDSLQIIISPTIIALTCPAFPAHRGRANMSTSPHPQHSSNAYCNSSVIILSIELY